MKKILLLTFSAGLFLIACKKSENESKQDQTCTVASIDVDGEKLYYTYDSQGRVTRIDHDTQQSNDYETITYHADRIVIFDKVWGETSPASEKTTTYTLDANGRIISDGRFTYTYNNEGYLIEERESGDFYTKFSYQNGNLVKMEEFQYGSTSADYTTVIDYNNETAQELAGYGNYIGLHLSPYYEILANYFGKASKNQFIKDTRTYKGDNTSDISTYTYQKDNTGKVISAKATDSDNDTEELKITYQCK